MDTQMINSISLTRQIREFNAQHLQGKTHAERIAYYRMQAQKVQVKISAKLSASDTRIKIPVPHSKTVA